MTNQTQTTVDQFTPAQAHQPGQNRTFRFTGELQHIDERYKHLVLFLSIGNDAVEVVIDKQDYSMSRAQHHLNQVIMVRGQLEETGFVGKRIRLVRIPDPSHNTWFFHRGEYGYITDPTWIEIKGTVIELSQVEVVEQNMSITIATIESDGQRLEVEVAPNTLTVGEPAFLRGTFIPGYDIIEGECFCAPPVLLGRFIGE